MEEQLILYAVYVDCMLQIIIGVSEMSNSSAVAFTLTEKI